MRKKCGYCGSDHPHRQCPAYGRIYKNCGETNHFKGVGRSNNGKGIQSITLEQEGTIENQN